MINTNSITNFNHLTLTFSLTQSTTLTTRVSQITYFFDPERSGAILGALEKVKPSRLIESEDWASLCLVRMSLGMSEVNPVLSSLRGQVL